MTNFFVGLDLGQSQDYTALAVVERREEAGEWDPVQYAYRKQAGLYVRQAVRFPLGTPYPAIAERVKEAVDRLEQQGGGVRLAADATGVGRAVMDLLRAKGLQRVLWPVVITGRHAERSNGTGYSTPKKDLLVGLQVLLERQALTISSRMKDSKALVKELGDLAVRVTGPGREEYGARGAGAHDDLVFALALACWIAQKTYPYTAASAVPQVRQFRLL